MSEFTSEQEHRRLLLKFLMGSPFMGLTMCAPQETKKEEVKKALDIISQASDAINVFDFEKVAQSKVPIAHFGYIATGVNDDLTLKANREAFADIKLKMRRLANVPQVDMTTELFGKKWPTPIVICPVGSQRAFHDEGELAVARAAKVKNHLQILSTMTTTSIEEVTQERGQPVWYQLYALTDWEGTKDMIKRAEDAGSEVLVFTVDLAAGTNNRETLQRVIKLDQRQCSNCHTENRDIRKPMVLSFKTADFESNLNWEYVDRLKATTKMKLIVKGIETAADAQLCLDHKVDGIFVSNHGGRASETGRGTIECLPEITAVVKKRIPVIIDGGFRRGTDIFKALAFGADAIGVGRPYIWGLGAFGQEGVEAVLTILTNELAMTMKQSGTATIKNITREYLAV